MLLIFFEKWCWTHPALPTILTLFGYVYIMKNKKTVKSIVKLFHRHFLHSTHKFAVLLWNHFREYTTGYRTFHKHNVVSHQEKQTWICFIWDWSNSDLFVFLSDFRQYILLEHLKLLYRRINTLKSDIPDTAHSQM